MTVQETWSDFPDVEAGSDVGIKKIREDGGDVRASTSVYSIRTDAFAPGEVIAGKYVVERVVGVGGVGVVLAAKHVELDEMVAIKFLHPEMQTRAEVVRRFANEARMAVRIKSEYAARVFDCGVEPERGPYLVMEYLEGRTLAEAIKAARITLAQAVEYALQICAAMAVAHSFGIVHRDIKPENLFLSRRHDGTEVIKVLDFGISKPALTGNVLGLVRSMVETQDIMGSPFYMSPEQIRSTATVDHRTDLWSIGIVLYEMLAGRMPFDGDTIPSVCAKVLETEAVPLSSFLTVPPAFDQVIAGCLQKDRANRFQSVADLTAALMPFGAGRGGSLPPQVVTLLEIETAPTISAPSPSGILGAPSTTAPLPASLPPADLLTDASDAKRRAWRSVAVATAAIFVGAAIAAVVTAKSPRSTADASLPAVPTARAIVASPPSPAEPPVEPSPLPTATAHAATSPPTRAVRAAPVAPVVPARGVASQSAGPTTAAPASTGTTMKATAPKSTPGAAPAAAASADPAEALPLPREGKEFVVAKQLRCFATTN